MLLTSQLEQGGDVDAICCTADVNLHPTACPPSMASAMAVQRTLHNGGTGQPTAVAMGILSLLRESDPALQVRAMVSRDAM